MQRIVVTIHGIRWAVKSDWQNDFAVFIKNKQPEVMVLPFRYGRLWGVFSWFVRVFQRWSWVRGWYIRKFRKFLAGVRKKHPDAEISVIAHSFGGYITEQVVGELPEINLRSIVYVHCPISCHIEQTHNWVWLEMGRVQQIHAWSSKQDRVIGRIAIPPFGKLGYYGYIRDAGKYPQDRVEPDPKPYAPLALYNHHTDEDHGGVLDRLHIYGNKLVDQLIGPNIVTNRPRL